MGNAIKAHKNLHTKQQNEHTPGLSTHRRVWEGQGTGVVHGSDGFLENGLSTEMTNFHQKTRIKFC